MIVRRTLRRISGTSVAPPTTARLGCYPWAVRHVRARHLAPAAALCAGALLLAACSSRPGALFAALHRRASNAATTAAPPGTRTAAAPPPPTQLPRGGRRILGRFRVVAFYGAPGGGQLGVLGATTPERAATAIEHQASEFRGFGLPVQPAMELLATVAQASPGPDGDYSAPIPHAEIRHYLRVAHEHKMLLILDIQPGRSTFLSEVKTLRPFLLDPSVSVALDSEWRVSADQVPGNGLIGSSGSADINAVEQYLSRIVRDNDLPDKLLVLHEFTASMLPDRANIHPAPGVETVFHADGFGTPAEKRGVYRRLRFPGRPFGAGFKLFFTQDSRLMTPAEVMRLRPRPDVVTYQ